MRNVLPMELMQTCGNVVKSWENPRKLYIANRIHLAGGISEREFEYDVLYYLSGCRAGGANRARADCPNDPVEVFVTTGLQQSPFEVY